MPFSPACSTDVIGANTFIITSTADGQVREDRAMRFWFSKSSMSSGLWRRVSDIFFFWCRHRDGSFSAVTMMVCMQRNRVSFSLKVNDVIYRSGTRQSGAAFFSRYIPGQPPPAERCKRSCRAFLCRSESWTAETESSPTKWGIGIAFGATASSPVILSPFHNTPMEYSNTMSFHRASSPFLAKLFQFVPTSRIIHRAGTYLEPSDHITELAAVYISTA